MRPQAKVGVIGDFDPAFPPHVATDAALRHAAERLGASVEVRWLATELLAEDDAARALAADALWCAPGSPYRSLEGALGAIRWARERDVPFLGTCGGFQHVVIEYARNVLGFADAQHAEYDPYASRLFVSELSCSLAGRRMQVCLRSQGTSPPAGHVLPGSHPAGRLEPGLTNAAASRWDDVCRLKQP